MDLPQHRTRRPRRLHRRDPGRPDGGARWQPWPPIELPRPTPTSIEVLDSGVTWTHGGSLFAVRGHRSQRLQEAPWLLASLSEDPLARTEKAIGPDAQQLSERVLDHSRGYVLLDDGTIRTFGRRGLTLGEAGLLVLFTGGLGMLAAPVIRLDTATDHAALPETVELAAGTGHLCMRNAQGSVACFGKDYGGQVSGWPSSVEVSSQDPPHPHPLESPATMLSAGDDHTCALLSDRTVRCWGSWGRRQVESAQGPSAWQELRWSRPRPDR